MQGPNGTKPPGGARGVLLRGSAMMSEILKAFATSAVITLLSALLIGSALILVYV